ncbi:MAG: sialate O-acetylesterase, partial [Tidjanibacter sp.]|nr:sialate O-acetylesterase [Tidjanibacter sp.]
ALIREAQMHNLKDIPGSGMVVTMDIGDAWCIHPAKKSEVGQRLAWLALTDTYGKRHIYSHSPVYESVRFSGGKAYVTFDVEGLCLGPYGHNVEGFEIAGEDRVFYPAKASTQRAKNSVMVHSPEVPNPVAVRYCFRNVAEATVFNNFGLPVSPFRTDDWPIAPLAK